MKDNIAISVENVSKNFLLPHQRPNSIKGIFTRSQKKAAATEQQHALKNISFDIKKGEFFGIVGRNGSGKSTMLKILAGIYQPTTGKVTTVGKLVPFIELGVGFNPELTGRENVFLNGAMLGFSEAKIAEMYDEIVEFAELERFMDQKLKNYSSGMQVRLAFSMATRSEADILLVDEVLAVGDADFQRKCFDYFKGLKKAKKTVIFVSHDMSAVREYCDRAIMIEKSVMVHEGKPDFIAAEYTKLFLEKEDKQLASLNSGKRWGTGAARYDKVTLENRMIDLKQELKFSAKVKFNKEVESPIYGYSVKNAAGEYIIGTNTKIKKVQTSSRVDKDETTIEWTVPNIFADGKYYISVAVGAGDGVTTLDWWEECAAFVVVREERTPYIVNPEVEVKVSDVKN